MLDIVDQLENEHIKKWYKENTSLGFLDRVVSENEYYGYVLDKKSGLLFRSPYSGEVVKNLGYTVIDIIFSIPVDLHYHTDVGEALVVKRGQGVLYTKSGSLCKEEAFSVGKSVFVPKNMPHSFRPDINDYLEISLSCTGILHDENEVCIKRFDEFEIWNKYYKSSRLKSQRGLNYI